MTRHSARLARVAIASALLGFAGFSFGGGSDGHDEHEESARGAVVVAGDAKVHEAAALLRDLWLDHAFWTRAVAVETFAGNKAATDAAERAVLANAKNIAAFFEPFYGRPATD